MINSCAFHQNSGTKTVMWKPNPNNIKLSITILLRFFLYKMTFCVKSQGFVYYRQMSVGLVDRGPDMTHTHPPPQHNLTIFFWLLMMYRSWNGKVTLHQLGYTGCSSHICHYTLFCKNSQLVKCLFSTYLHPGLTYLYTSNYNK